MIKKFTPEQEKLLDKLPKDRSIGNRALRGALKWSREKYDQVRYELVAAGEIAIGRGRGGSVRRVAADAEALLNCLPLDGGWMTNAAVMARLGWSPEKYWQERARLIDQGLAITGRGPGGRVARVVADDEAAEESADIPDEVTAAPLAGNARIREVALYPSIRSALREGWCQDMGFIDSPIVEIIPYHGRKKTGGMWSRPDLVVVGRRDFMLLPDTYFDVCTIEVKAVDGWNLAAIHEASAHRRFATRAYALFVVPDQSDRKSEIFEECKAEARRLSVGLITVADPGNYETWVPEVEAEAHEPDPARLQEFLQVQLTPENQEKIRGWWKK